MRIHMLATAVSVLLVPSLAGSGAPSPTPTHQMRGAGSTVPTQFPAFQEPRGKPDAVWVEGHSRSGIFVPGHWQ